MKSFCLFSGLEVNYDKTEVLRLGSLCYTDAEFYSGLPVKWSDGPVRILGIQVYPDQKLMAKNNYDELFIKANNILKMWGKRSLSLLGKILVINVLIIPLFIYRMQVLKTPDALFFKKFRQLVIEFLWESKKAQIAYEKLLLNFEKGGLKLQDIEYKNTAIKCKWVQLSRLEDPLFNQLLSAYTCLDINTFWGTNLYHNVTM